MRRTLAVIVIVPLLIAAASNAVSAATWFTLRTTLGGTGNWTDSTAPIFSDIPSSWSQTTWGGTLLFKPPARPFGLRLNFDYGSMGAFTSCSTCSASPYTGGTWSMWDLSVAYAVTMPTGMFVVFAGYGWNSFDPTAPVGFSRQSSSGFVFGFDAMVPLGGGPWYFAGTLTFGPSQSYTYEIGSPGSVYDTGTASVTTYGAGIGYRISPTSAIEVGWRSGGFTVSATPSLEPDGHDLRWSGIYLAWTVTMP